MTNEQFAEECRNRRINYDKLFQPRETPEWMRAAEKELQRGAATAVRRAVRATARQFVASPALLDRVDRLLPHLERTVALQRVADLRAQAAPIHGLRGCHTTVNLVAAERALKLLIRLERRWQYRLNVMNSERPL